MVRRFLGQRFSVRRCVDHHRVMQRLLILVLLMHHLVAQRLSAVQMSSVHVLREVLLVRPS